MIPTIVPGVRNPRYIFVLAVVAALILVVGALTRPMDEAAPPASDADLARISRLAERRSLEDMTSYFSEIAANADLSLVRLRDLPTSAIAWDANRIVAARIVDPFPTEATFETPSGEIIASVVLRRPDLPVVAIAAPPTAALVPVRRSSVLPQSGTWIMALWAGTQARSFVYGHVLDTMWGSCGELLIHQVVPTFALEPSMAGGGIFDIDGNFLGLVLQCQNRMVAVLADSLDVLLTADNSLDSQVLSRYGFRADVLSADEAAFVGRADGLIVREVWVRYPAHKADLRPGDIIRAIDDVPIAGPEDLLRLVGGATTASPRLAIRRGIAKIEIVLEPDGASLDAEAGEAPGRGLTLRSSEGFLIDAVAAESAAARAGMQSGDRLIRINRITPESEDRVRRLLDGDRSGPTLVELERNGRRFSVLLPGPA
ncbi:MAG: hypothetical protein HQ485_05440 [Acidobacteria bacterium]|nr:hypothetical protein [Acidobacteriota bacterium]